MSVNKNILTLYEFTIKQFSGFSAAAKKFGLLYKCNPFAYIIEMAGGRATDGKQRIMDIQPTSLHQCTPFFIGSMYMMNELDTYIEGEK